jgi:hypothetical protein
MANEQNLTPFKKGHKTSVGHGRPKGSRSLVTILKEALAQEIPIKNKETGKTEKKLVAELVIAGLVRNAVKGDIRHAREILDRLEGKPMQSIESHTRLDLGNMNLSSLSNEQLEKLIKDNTANDD